MPSIPLTPEEEKHALEFIGVGRIEDLFSTVPPKIRENANFKLEYPAGFETANERGLTEHELRRYLGSLAEKNAHFPKYTHFLGGGVYDNIVPAIVNQLTLRGEFLTCYTPYQPEVSQGTLQVIFEFQTMMSRLTGMEVANASMYDGSTATAEAALMCQRISGGKRQLVLAAGSLNPEYRGVLDTFLEGHTRRPETVGWTKDGTIDLESLKEQMKAEAPSCVIVGYPNYFGVVEDLAAIKAVLPKETMLVVAVADPSALSIFEAPGNLGADIVVGEAHQLGTPMLFGGPHVGFFASRREYLRQMPGRLCGESVDARGQRAYTLTLSTREQHIRREKATSNICTNQGLIALRTTIYLSFLGKQGFRNLGETNFSLFDYLAKSLESHGIPLKFKLNCYREGVFEVPNLTKRFEKAVSRKIIPGILVAEKLREAGIETKGDFASSLLVCVSPKHTKHDLDQLVEVLSHD